ncbi:ethanolamine utilization protein EutJ [Sorangium cellulosum]|uniref:Ethanolamine utilization protein EutJ n=1 Tax=Sorangium cellulosum TaxID=56 RepID=A0A2L0F954_SORCE|nr:ABC transporter substrate-binding protein [Sorangium cellulosum]AUX48118.1 ethanolamine utilization protein EutJ [Sorangium cellulosum]
MLGRRGLVRMIAGALALSAMALGCGKKSEGSGGDPAKHAKDDPEWKVGAYFSLSGEETAFGVDSKEGIDLAIDEINKAGGVKGKPINVLYEDNKSKPEEATNKVLQLIDRDHVLALLGEVASSRSRAGGIVANRKKVPMISPSSTNPDVTKVGPFVFRACFTDDVQGQMGAQFIANTLGKKKVGLLFASDDLYSSGLANEFRAEMKRLGGEIVMEKSFLKNETNFTTYINELKSVNPEMIYAPIYYTAMAPIARQAKAAGVPGSLFVGTDGWDANELLRDAAEELDGAYFTNHYAPDVPWPNSQAFVKKYQERYKRTPSSIAAQGYDAARLLADAMGRAKAMTPDDIRQAIQDTKGFQGATGVITIDENRNADKPVVIVRIKDKQFTYYATVNDKAAKQ